MITIDKITQTNEWMFLTKEAVYSPFDLTAHLAKYLFEKEKAGRNFTDPVLTIRFFREDYLFKNKHKSSISPNGSINQTGFIDREHKNVPKKEFNRAVAQNQFHSKQYNLAHNGYLSKFGELNSTLISLIKQSIENDYEWDFMEDILLGNRKPFTPYHLDLLAESNKQRILSGEIIT